jgi:2-keto-myo-inositol isomerase
MARFLNGATIMSTPTPRSLEVAREAGFDGIEARAERLLEDPAEVAATAEMVRAGDVWSLNGIRISLRADGTLDRERLEADLEPRLDVCRAIGAMYLLAVPPRVSGLSEESALPAIRAGLELVRDRAAADGVGVAFEFLGFADCPIRNPAAAGRVVDGLAGVGIVLDSCHWHASGSGSLDPLPVDRLALVHLNDAPAKPPEQIEDADRVLPGLGVIRLPELIAALSVRLETFNPEYWEADALTVARQGEAALDALLGMES